MVGGAPKHRLRLGITLVAAAIVLVAAPQSALAGFLRQNNTPFPTSQYITYAQFTSKRYNPPKNQYGDILPTVWTDDGNQFVLINDGGTGLSRGLWQNSFARITGTPPNIGFQHVGNPHAPPPATWTQINRDPKLHTGVLGPYYSDGFVAIGNTFFATQTAPWAYNQNQPFTGLAGIAYSTNEGQTWTGAGPAFPAPLGNLTWVARDQGEAHPDGYVYAINSEREFNASTLILGRALPDVGDMTNPASWQWLSGWWQSNGVSYPTWSSSVSAAIPILSWTSHITYPEMAYDAAIHRYLLTFTHSYVDTEPGIWRDGAELDLLESPNQWGPFSFVGRVIDFGPSNGYGAGFPVQWISRNGRTLWMKWAANFDGCYQGLDCSGAYGFNYERVQLSVAANKYLP